MKTWTLADHEGKSLDAYKHRYMLRFEAVQMPPMGAFWSTTGCLRPTRHSTC
ncbi:DUF1214 domain-containing protein [Chloroflexota bacterium]